MTVSTGSIAEDISNTVQGIPSSISTGSITMWVEKAKIKVQNYTGDTIPNADVQERFQNILFNLGSAYTLASMLGVGVRFSAKLAEFSVQKGGANGSQTMDELQFHVNEANMDLSLQERKISYGRSW